MSRAVDMWTTHLAASTLDADPEGYLREQLTETASIARVYRAFDALDAAVERAAVTS